MIFKKYLENIQMCLFTYKISRPPNIYRQMKEDANINSLVWSGKFWR